MKQNKENTHLKISRKKKKEKIKIHTFKIKNKHLE